MSFKNGSKINYGGYKDGEGELFNHKYMSTKVDDEGDFILPQSSFYNFYKRYNKIFTGGALVASDESNKSNDTIGLLNNTDADNDELIKDNIEPTKLEKYDQIETLINFVRMMGNSAPIANIMLPDKDEVIKEAIELELIKKDGDNLVINTDKLKFKGGKKRKSKREGNKKQSNNKNKSKRKSKRKSNKKKSKRKNF